MVNFIIGIAVFVVFFLILGLVIYTIYFLHKTDQHNRKLYTYIENDVGEHVLFMVPKKEVMSHVDDYEEVQKQIKRKKTLELNFMKENNIKNLDYVEMPTDMDLTPTSRSTNSHYPVDIDQTSAMMPIREQNEQGNGDGQDPFLVDGNYPQTLNINMKETPNVFNFDDSEANRKLLSQNSLMSKKSGTNWSINTNLNSDNRGVSSVFDKPGKFELPSSSDDLRSFRIPYHKFEEYNYLDKKHKQYSSFF